MKIKRLFDFYDDLETYIFEAYDTHKIFIPLVRLLELRYKLEFKLKRLGCYLFGCDVHGGHGGFNLAYEAYYYDCRRCGAVESNYEGDSYHKFLEGKFKK